METVWCCVTVSQPSVMMEWRRGATQLLAGRTHPQTISGDHSRLCGTNMKQTPSDSFCKHPRIVTHLLYMNFQRHSPAIPQNIWRAQLKVKRPLDWLSSLYTCPFGMAAMTQQLAIHMCVLACVHTRTSTSLGPGSSTVFAYFQTTIRKIHSFAVWHLWCKFASQWANNCAALLANSRLFHSASQ